MGEVWRPRGPDDIDDFQRARIRGLVLGLARPRRRDLSDLLYDTFSILAAPAPYIARAMTAAALVVALAGSAAVASAESMPGDALYPVKIGWDRARLSLALTPADRAAVQLSVIQHRLAEAERAREAARIR